MEAVKIKIHPLFIILSFVLIYFGWWLPFVTYLVVMCLHECAHWIVAKCLGYKTNNVIFMPYGIALDGKNIFFVPAHEVSIALAGPLFNMLLCGLTIIIWWAFPQTVPYTKVFFESNLFLGLFNLLPLFPLDGGRILLASIKNSKRKIIMYKIMFWTGLLVSIFFAACFVVSVFYTINVTLIFVSFFILSSCLGYNEQVYFERGLLNINKTDAPLEIKSYAVNYKTPIHKLVRYIKGYTYVQFFVYDDNQELIKIITESDIQKIVNSKRMSVGKERP